MIFDKFFFVVNILCDNLNENCLNLLSLVD